MRTRSDAGRVVEMKRPKRHATKRPDDDTPAKPGPRARGLVAGPDVKLLQISRAGALLESDSRLYTGSHICLRLNLGDATFLLKGRVLRSRASAPEGSAARYESAVAFEDDFVLRHEELTELMEPKPPRGCRPRLAGTPGKIHSSLPSVTPSGGIGLPPTILSEALLSGQTVTDLRRILEAGQAPPQS